MPLSEAGGFDSALCVNAEADLQRLAGCAGRLFFLTIQFGGFVVFETAILVDDARDTRSRAFARMGALRPRSSQAVVVVNTVIAALALVAGGVTLGIAAGWGWLGDWRATAFLFTVAFAVALIGVFHEGLLADGRSECTLRVLDFSPLQPAGRKLSEELREQEGKQLRGRPGDGWAALRAK